MNYLIDFVIFMYFFQLMNLNRNVFIFSLYFYLISVSFFYFIVY